MPEYQLLCWKTDHLDPGNADARRIKSAKVGDFTNDPDWDSNKYEVFEPGKMYRLPFSLSANEVYWDPSVDTNTHNGSSDASMLTDTTKSWTVGEFVGAFIYNTTDGSYGKITANTATTISAVLVMGTDNDWDFGDIYVIRRYYIGSVKPTFSEEILEYLDDNAVWQDPVSGLYGPPDFMQAMVNRREIFGNGDNPLGTYSGNMTGRLNNLETIHSKGGWHHQSIFEARYSRPSDLLIYYGWLNGFNSAMHSWNNEEVAKELSKYSLLVIGSGLVTLYDSGDHDGSDNASVLTDSSKSWTTNQWVGYRLYNLTDGSSGAITANTGTTITATLAGGTDNDWDGSDLYEIRHGDYANTSIILPRLKQLRPEIQIFGYVDGTLSLSDFEDAVDNWDTAGVTGIFIDKAGYDYGTTTTNSRSAMNTKVDYVHGKTTSNMAMMNAWNMDHIIGTENDTSYPNTTWNSGDVESTLDSNDWYLLESTPINTTAYTSTGGYQSKSDWSSRGVKAIGHRQTYKINVAACGIINDSNSNGQDLFDFGFIAALMFSLEAWGTSDTSYGASSSATKWWTRPDIFKLGLKSWLNPSVQVDAGDSDVYWRYAQFGRLKLDFSSSAQDSDIETW